MDIEHLAKLASLKLTDAEKKKFSNQMGTIIKYIEKLSELDTENVEPTAHVLGLNNVFREDVATEPLTDQSPINDSPAHSKGHYEVPKII
ncbi:MAG TPA: Asp-tRNA(Asn)/Glu-tRNA(Gln) amidotransferase subunit GatC [Nitrospinae bacterium]|jgi:aspartyl-tRNA(Asn)/glutamyl-tRNA(Gln) amidotransferase subunit C|nr:Asp-tRNA(Asn)/Glu-tRNA(Gln) amidotransferase subunit GatC [Nitrospinota bacterium]